MLTCLTKPLCGLAVLSLLMAGSSANAAESLRLPVQPAAIPASALEPLPAEMTDKARALTRDLPPPAKTWIGEEAARLARTPEFDEAGLRAAIRARFAPNRTSHVRKAGRTETERSGDMQSSYDNAVSNMGLSDGDIEQVAFIVLMAATSDMDRDLKAIMAEVKSMTAAKQKLRELLAKVRLEAAAHAGGAGEPCVSALCKQYAAISGDAASAPISTVGELAATQKNLTDKLDSMNEMSEATSLRLQMAMDRRSKFVSTLSNMMKKMSETSSSIIQNLK